MDVASSIAGLIALAELVIGRGIKFIALVKSAPKDIQTLLKEVTELYTILRNLNAVLVRLGPSTALPNNASKFQHITNCHAVLHETHEVLSKLDISGAALKARAIWPFKVSDVEKLVERIKRSISFLSLALQAEEMGIFLELLSSQEKVKASLGRLEVSQDTIEQGVGDLRLEQDRVAKEKLRADEERKFKNICKYLEPFAPQGFHCQAREQRQPGTSEWFIESEEYKEWLATPNGKLWIYGIPGAGKTIIMSALIQNAYLVKDKQQNSKVAVAYWYCTYREPRSQVAANIMGSLLAQLARQTDAESCYSDLVTLCPDTDQELSLLAVDLASAIKKISRNFTTVMLFVDGLDECPRERRLKTLELISGLAEESIKLLVASRNENDIRSMFEGFKSSSVSASPPDIKLFVCSETEKRVRSKNLNIVDPELKLEIMEVLVAKADGMFQWVICQLDEICRQIGDEQKRRALRRLPRDLYSTYERILAGAYKDPHVRRMVKSILMWMTHCQRNFTARQLAVAIYMLNMGRQFNNALVPSEDDLLRWCGSLIRQINPGRWNNMIEFSHFTVKEYLLAEHPDSETEDTRIHSYFFVKPAEATVVMARTCAKLIFYIQHYEPGRKTWEETPYASWYDDGLLEDLVRDVMVLHEDDEEVFEYLCGLFGIPSISSGLTPTSWRTQAAEARSEVVANPDRPIEMWNRLYPPPYQIHFTPLQWAARLGLPRLCKRLLEFGASPNYNGMSQACPGVRERERGCITMPLNLVLETYAPPWRLGQPPAVVHPYRSTRERFAKVFQILLEGGAEFQQHDGKVDNYHDFFPSRPEPGGEDHKKWKKECMHCVNSAITSFLDFLMSRSADTVFDDIDSKMFTLLLKHKPCSASDVLMTLPEAYKSFSSAVLRRLHAGTYRDLSPAVVLDFLFTHMTEPTGHWTELARALAKKSEKDLKYIN